MSNQDYNCTDQRVDQATEQTPKSDSWTKERPVKTAELPEAMVDNMSQYFNESIEASDNMNSAIPNVVKAARIAVDEFCQVEGKPPHYTKTDQETYYFRSFYDGIEPRHFVNELLEIRTETPTNEPIEIQASSESNIDVAPSSAVMSFGVATDKDVPAGDIPTVQEVYEAVCPYVKASYTPDNYERWSEDGAATTVGIPLESGMPIAAALRSASPPEGTA